MNNKLIFIYTRHYNNSEGLVKSFDKKNLIDNPAEEELKDKICMIYDRLDQKEKKDITMDNSIRDKLQIIDEVSITNFKEGVCNNIKLWEEFVIKIKGFDKINLLPLIKYKQNESNKTTIILHGIFGKNGHKIYDNFKKIVEEVKIKFNKAIIIVHGNDFVPPLEPGFVTKEKIIGNFMKNLENIQKENLIVFSMTHDDFDPINKLFKNEPKSDKDVVEYIESNFENIFFKEKFFEIKEYALALKRLGITDKELWGPLESSINEIKNYPVSEESKSTYDEIKSLIVKTLNSKK